MQRMAPSGQVGTWEHGGNNGSDGCSYCSCRSYQCSQSPGQGADEPGTTAGALHRFWAIYRQCWERKERGNKLFKMSAHVLVIGDK